MSINYDAIYGLGYQIECPIDENNEDTYRYTLDGLMRDMFDFSKYVRSSSKYYLTETGDTFDTEETEWYIFLKEGFPKYPDVDLTDAVKKLTEYCQEMKFNIIGKFGLHGGLRIS
jgi:hypothetical protein